MVIKMCKFKIKNNKIEYCRSNEGNMGTMLCVHCESYKHESIALSPSQINKVI